VLGEHEVYAQDEHVLPNERRAFLQRLANKDRTLRVVSITVNQTGSAELMSALTNTDLWKVLVSMYACTRTCACVWSKANSRNDALTTPKPNPKNSSYAFTGNPHPPPGHRRVPCLKRVALCEFRV